MSEAKSVQFRYSPVDYPSRRGRDRLPGKSSAPGEDANSTTDKLARRADDTCKIGRQEDARASGFEFDARQMRSAAPHPSNSIPPVDRVNDTPGARAGYRSREINPSPPQQPKRGD
jgi:hypothetical protein